MKRRFVLIALLGLNLETASAASQESPKLKAFTARLAKPQSEFTWLDETTRILLQSFSKDPDAEKALTAWLKARENMMGPLYEKCNADVDQWARFLGEHDIYPDDLLIDDFEKALKKAKNLPRDSRIIADVRRCLRMGTILGGVGEGFYAFQENPGLVNAMRAKLSLPEDPVLKFLENEHNILVDDMSLTMSWDALRQRIIRWEEFTRKLGPKTAERYPELGEVNWMMDIYLGKLGLDNSPTMVDGKPEKEWLASLKKFAKENRKSRFIKDVDAALKKL